MSSNRQLLVALGLAAAVLIIGFHGSSVSGKEPALVTQARLRQTSSVRLAGSGRPEREGAAGDTFDRDAVPMGIEERLSEMPLVQVLALLSGGAGGPDGLTGGSEPDASSPDQDWGLLVTADSLLRSPQIRRLAERLVAQGVGGN